jgi:predicted outer membrane repeat protein
LRQAIDKAGPGDTVSLPAGPTPYALTINELVVNKSITIAGAGARSVVVDAGKSTFRVFRVSGVPQGVTISGLTITGGVVPEAVTGSGGGGILADTGSAVRVVDSTITGNQARGDGGGIFATGASLELLNSTVAGNHATPAANGGGISTKDGASSSIVNSTIVGNTATNVGGALVGQGTPLHIVNSTITGNSSGSSGGGLYRSSTGPPFGFINIKNTIIAGNSSGIAGQGNCVGVDFANPVSAGHNLEDTDTCGLNQPGDLKNTPAMLGPLQDNGGQTDSEAPLAGSAAIDAGDNSGCPATDQRGQARPVWGASALVCDIGAVELAPSNDFQITRKARCKTRRCRAVLVTLNLPGPGSVASADALARGRRAAPSAKRKKRKRLVKPGSAAAGGSGPLVLQVKLTKVALKKLRRRHKLRLSVRFEFTPVGGSSNAKTQSLRVKPKRRRHR